MCENQRLTYLTDWPCDLLMVIAKQILSGNCFLSKLNEIWDGEGVRVILGMKTFFPLSSSDINSILITRVDIFEMIPLVPLQTLSAGKRFLRTITGQPILSFNFAKGRPEQLMLLRYSAGYISSPSFGLSLTTLSWLKKTRSSPGNSFSMRSLRSSTSSLQLESIIRSEKYWWRGGWSWERPG